MTKRQAFLFYFKDLLPVVRQTWLFLKNAFNFLYSRAASRTYHNDPANRYAQKLTAQNELDQNIAFFKPDWLPNRV
jgi:hypothetical protein